MLPLAIAAGDPAGVGPEATARALARHQHVGAIVFGDAAQLREWFERVGVDAAIVDVGRCPQPVRERHEDDPASGAIAVAALDAAVAYVQSGGARGLVTGPVSKAAIHRAGVSFVGQTEHLARAAGLADDDVTMLFLGERLRVGLVTTHLAVRALPEAVTTRRVERTIEHLHDAVGRLVGRRPSITVTGLNPHAGEHGMFGDEEALWVAPAVEHCRARGLDVRGPIPAEAAFRAAQAGHADAIAAMFHDQATIASKLLDWGTAVNTTWGLPFVRTSVDHGVAYDAARAGAVDARGMEAALALAHRLTGGPP